MSNHLIFKRYTIDGVTMVQSKDSVEDTLPLKHVDICVLPTWFKPEHTNEVRLFHSMVVTIKKEHPNRQVPITRTEFIRAGGNQRVLDQLVKVGIVNISIIPITKKGGNKNTGSRSCVYYTPEGRAFVRENIDSSYALKEEGVQV